MPEYFQKSLNILNVCIFQIDKWLNRLIIYDGPDEKSMKIGEVYGNLNNKLLKSVSSSGKTMFIDIKKQYHLGSFKVEASIKYNKIMPACQTWLDVDTYILTSPNHSNSTNCRWLITSNFGSYITLNFKFIEVNSKTRVIL